MLQHIVCAVYFFIGFVDIFLSITFQNQLNGVFFTLFLSTNPNEAQEFVEFYSSFKIILCLLGFILSSLLFFAPLSFLRLPTLSSGRALAFTLLIIGSSLIGYQLHSISQEGSARPFLMDKNSILRWFYVINNTIKHQLFVQEYISLSKQMDTSTAQRHDEVTTTRQIPYIVIILGESNQRGYMSLYDYPLNTTPHLKKLYDEGKIIRFDDVVAPDSSTDMALQKILTFSRYENKHIPWFEQQNLIDILLSGYKTSWFSNQEIISIFGNSPTILSQRAHRTLFANKHDSLSVPNLTDGVLLTLLDEDLPQMQNTDSKKPHLYIIHMIGSHPVYRRRYPQNFTPFTSQDLRAQHLDTLPDGQILTSSQLETKVQYLKAIAYTDYVVSEIFKRFEDKNAIVFYFSDHGQEVYNTRDFAGHAANRFGVEVPFVVHMSERFKQQYPEIAQRIQDAKSKPFMNDDFIHALLDIAGIQSKDFDESLSLFSPHFNAKRARITTGSDYDTELKKQ